MPVLRIGAWLVCSRRERPRSAAIAYIKQRAAPTAESDGIGMALWRAGIGMRGSWRGARRSFLGPGSSDLAASLADASVDPFPQQVGVAAVAGVLLDHVDKHFAQRDGVSVSHSPADAEIGRAGDELLREGDLVAPGSPGIINDRRVGDRAGPVSIRQVPGPVQRRRVGLR